MKLTHSDADETLPAWSPKRDMICFVRNSDGKRERQIHVMDSNGKRQKLLDNTLVYNPSPTWSPRGDKIAFVNKPDWFGLDYRVYTIDPNGHNKQLLFKALDGLIKKISWSPNGRQIVFVYYSRDGTIQELRMLNVHTREVDTIDWKMVDNFRLVEIANAAWAPIGRTIVFSAKPKRPVPAVFPFRHGIFLVDPDGDKTQKPEPLWDTFSAEEQYRKQRFSWSPDGQSILFSRGDGNLYVTKLNGGGSTRYFNNAHSPDWKTPRVWRSVRPKNKLQTTWGEVKEINRAQN